MSLSCEGVERTRYTRHQNKEESGANGIDCPCCELETAGSKCLARLMLTFFQYSFYLYNLYYPPPSPFTSYSIKNFKKALLTTTPS